ncbi:MAG: hypothetical protein ACRC8Q_10875 [Aeromonas sp.]
MSNTITINAEIDMSEISDSDLLEEVISRRREAMGKPPYEVLIEALYYALTGSSQEEIQRCAAEICRAHDYII